MRTFILAGLFVVACTSVDPPPGGGPGTVDATAAATCGNGIVEAGEQCDDGNATTEACSYGQTSCMVCSSTCQLVAGATSYCGDGRVDPAHEACDTRDCSANCGTHLCVGNYYSGSAYIAFDDSGGCSLVNGGFMAACTCPQSSGSVTISCSGSSVSGMFAADCSSMSSGGLTYVRM